MICVAVSLPLVRIFQHQMQCDTLQSVRNAALCPGTAHAVDQDDLPAHMGKAYEQICPSADLPHRRSAHDLSECGRLRRESYNPGRYGEHHRDLLQAVYQNFDVGADMPLEGGNGTHDLIGEMANGSNVIPSEGASARGRMDGGTR